MPSKIGVMRCFECEIHNAKKDAVDGEPLRCWHCTFFQHMALTHSYLRHSVQDLRTMNSEADWSSSLIDLAQI